MSPANASRRSLNTGPRTARSEAQALARGETASYLDPRQTFEESLPNEQRLSSGRHASSGFATHLLNPYGYTENAGEAGEIYVGPAPPISYQQTLPISAPASAAPIQDIETPAAAVSRRPDNAEHGDAGWVPIGNYQESDQGPAQATAPQHGPHIRPGLRGLVGGFVALARRRPHVRDDTPARLELLRRADKFFNDGFVGKHGRLNKGKTALFGQEIERMEEAKLKQV
ncbi:hypothetical protein CLAFUW4_01050 [Fulvia fulva]|uniref:Uncharacterized protein n=1 Tax=Passalora fulva TaxID=5499 RepID=A0A9Q8L7Y1_PASFU|nr:uncharacterized protein CLAFUR5_01055 [Fulvia fulva]KAK4634484.1 hypothetical protein CLAFUR4_01051 [Fulvia fulva]KAK4636877.1 hypothetical protein CLAFUR0_01052 [Fulvia fulva]UJO12513.1 hypothetical protein CLAFUR5_01055 [Fulvia fulva]WPV09462.1 hypothetical protein CLAFUW4_01050 [Fulvia fulva]WPV23444.1 hypothetical protein CLAFUW7_01055 [Fulvia fulva]